MKIDGIESTFSKINFLCPSLGIFRRTLFVRFFECYQSPYHIITTIFALYKHIFQAAL
jgi:hypothetical protein